MACRDSLDRKIVGLGPAAREYDGFAIAPEQSADPGARLIEHSAGCLPLLVDTGGITENLCQKLSMKFEYFW
jgi:hypothetical protein